MLQIDRKAFFDGVRPVLGGRLTQGQVTGTGRLLDEASRINLTHAGQLAYILATSAHETDRKMQPISEYGRGRGRDYGRPHPKTGLVYYGRGDVQLTWYDNYLAMERLLGVPLSTRPELALDPTVSAMVLFEGMLRGRSDRGDFTGRALEQYVSGSRLDFEDARRVVNGTDQDDRIAGYARTIHGALVSAGMGVGSDWTDSSTRALQMSLRTLGYDVVVDGAAGVRTTSAVRDFQTRHGLLPDGIAGPATWAEIRQRVDDVRAGVAPPPAPAEPVPDLVTQASVKDQIQDILRRLAALEAARA